MATQSPIPCSKRSLINKGPFMRIGIFGGDTATRTITEIIADAAACEAEGFDSYWLPQIFALDATIPAEAGADYAALTKAMDGHVLASGEVVGHGIADPNAPPPAPRPAAAPAPKQ